MHIKNEKTNKTVNRAKLKLQLQAEMQEAMKRHVIAHKFEDYLRKTFGKDCWGKPRKVHVGDGKMKTIRDFDEVKLAGKLIGFEIMERIEKYCRRHIPEIIINYCDDKLFSTSMLLLIPHPEMGVTVMYIPQNTTINNTFFLYPSHIYHLVKGLDKIKNQHMVSDQKKEEFEQLENRNRSLLTFRHEMGLKHGALENLAPVFRFNSQTRIKQGVIRKGSYLVINTYSSDYRLCHLDRKTGSVILSPAINSNLIYKFLDLSNPNSSLAERRKVLAEILLKIS